MCKGGGTNTVTQQSQPPPQVMQNYENVMNRANQVASQPLQQYGGGLLAGFNPEQTAAFGNVNQYAYAAQPWLQTAGGMTSDAAQAIWPQVQQFSGQNVQQYMSPYVQNVVDTTMKEIQNQNAIQGQSLLGQGIAAGNAFGGDRAGVAAAQLANQQALAQNQQIAQLYNQGYGQALGEFNQQQMAQFQGLTSDAARQMQAAQQLGALGQTSQNLGLTGAQAQLGVGGMQQQLQQEQLNIPYQMYLQQQGYPFQTTQWLGGLAEGIGSQMGGTSQTGYPSPSMLSQLAGLGMTGAGIIGGTGGFGAGGWLTGLLAAKRGGRIGYDRGGNVVDLGERRRAHRPPFPPRIYGNPLDRDTLPLVTMHDRLLNTGFSMYPDQPWTATFPNERADGGGVSNYDNGGPVDGLAGGGGIDNSGGLGASTYDVADPMGGMAGYYEDLAAMAKQYGLASPMGQYAQRMLIARRTSPELNTGASWAAPPPTDPSAYSPQGLAQVSGAMRRGGAVPHYQEGGDITDPLASGPDYQGNIPPVDSSQLESTITLPHEAPRPPATMQGGLSVVEQGPRGAGLAGTGEGRSIYPDPLPTPAISAHEQGARGTRPSGPLGGQETRNVYPEPRGPAGHSGQETRNIYPEAPGAGGGAGGGGDTSATHPPGGGPGGGPPAPPSGGGVGTSTPLPGSPTTEDGLGSAKQPGQGGDWANNFMTGPWGALMMAGLGVMGGTSPNAMVNIGQGATRGVQDWMGMRKSAVEMTKTAAEAQKEQVEAAVKKQQLAMIQNLQAGDGGGSGSGNTAGTADAQHTAGVWGWDPAHLYPAADRLFKEAQAWSVMPEYSDYANMLRQRAMADPQFVYVQKMLGDGMKPDGQGGFTIDPTVLNAKQKEALLSGIQPSSNMLFMDGNGQLRPAAIQKTMPDGSTQLQWDPNFFNSGSRPATQATQQQVEAGQKYAPLFKRLEQQYNLPPGLLASVAYNESRFGQYAVSPKGALGMFQLMPATAKQYGVDPYNIEASADAAAHMLQTSLKARNGNVVAALADYNWGSGNDDGWYKAGADRSKLPADVQSYVSDVLAGVDGTTPIPGIGTAQTNADGTVTLSPGGAEATTGEKVKISADMYRKAQAAFYAAQGQLGQIDQMASDLEKIPETGFLSGGAGAEGRADFAKTINGYLGALGIKNAIFDGDTLGTIDGIKKLTTNMGFALANTQGADAQAITQEAMAAVPNITNTKQGARLIISTLRQIAQRQVDMYNYYTPIYQSPNATLIGADAQFAKDNPVSRYVTLADLGAADQNSQAHLLQESQDQNLSKAFMANEMKTFDKKYGAGTAEALLKLGQVQQP